MCETANLTMHVSRCTYRHKYAERTCRDGWLFFYSRISSGSSTLVNVLPCEQSFGRYQFTSPTTFRKEKRSLMQTVCTWRYCGLFKVPLSYHVQQFFTKKKLKKSYQTVLYILYYFFLIFHLFSPSCIFLNNELWDVD